MQLLRMRIALGAIALVAGLALIVFATVNGAFAMSAAAPLAALVLGIVTVLLGHHLLFDALVARRAKARRVARVRRALAEVRTLGR